jgi:hypothetical protein
MKTAVMDIPLLKILLGHICGGAAAQNKIRHKYIPLSFLLFIVV